MFLVPFEEGELEEALDYDHLVIWQLGRQPAGFALLTRWVPGNYGITAFAVAQSGRGEGARFLGALIDWLLQEPEAHRISLDTTPDNVAALGLFEKLGFQREGLFRECWKRPDGIWSDAIPMALLRRDWRGRG